MENNGYSPELRKLVAGQLELGRASKRARDVAELILTNGSCTTSDIEALGYKHAPRAIGDLRDAGVEIAKEMESYFDPALNSNKRRARYSIGGVSAGRESRRMIPKRIADEVKKSGSCEICAGPPPLQVDHRVPFEVGGETYPHEPGEFMPLCPSCNRTKSWECEHCENRIGKNIEVCKSCIWASPNDYQHIALTQVRRVSLVLTDSADISRYDRFRPNPIRMMSEYLRMLESRDEE